ncbi:MAG: bifunctional lysylphosphatidylglycerol flippase/synthetase MprF [Gammaproteobacteria bacterium]|nr:bifunctional lysylphosphatidylglycerol flippase/synthetase MprF [Gammaproteobacteria bacterium]
MESQLGKKLMVQIGALISIVIVSAAFWVIYNTLHTISLHDLRNHLTSFPIEYLILALLITFSSYLTITGYDIVALHHIRRKVKYSSSATASFLASVFGNNIGFAMLTGTSIRYRIYSLIGLSTVEVAAVSSMCALTTIFGMSVIFALSMVMHGADSISKSDLPFSPILMRAMGWIILASVTGYILYSRNKPLTITLGNWSIRLPASLTILKQITLGTTNLCLVALLIYVLLPSGIDLSYLGFLGVFAIALIAGSASNVPGGIGVFESVILLGLPQISPAALLASILMFRMIYYLTPLIIASIVFTWHEAMLKRESLEGIQDTTFDVLHEFGPQILSMLVLLAGIILLLSGSIPIGFDRKLLVLHIPLSVVELSHLMGAAAGLGLFLAARGISKRLYSAFWLAVVLLVTGIVTSLLKGLGFKEAISLSLVLILLWLARVQFYRKATLHQEGFPVEWVSLLSVTLVTTVWLGLFSFKEIPYTTELWTLVGFDHDYSRFLRSIALVLVIASVFTLVYLLRPDPLPQRPESEVLETIRKILANAREIRSNLVLLGDKRIFFSPTEHSFLMYQIYGKSWVVLGSPIGDEKEFAELVWQFRGLCDRYGGWPVFFLVDDAHLTLYEDFDLLFEQLGEDVMIPLKDYAFNESLSPELQGIHRVLTDAGAVFEVVSGDALEPLIPELKAVSDSWLEQNAIVEYGYSDGFFDPFYIRNFSCAVVRINRQLMAFAVILDTADQKESGLDLRRFHQHAPDHIMDFLQIELIGFLQHQGVANFNMGLVPAADHEYHPLKPVLSRTGAFLYHSNHAALGIGIDELRQWLDQYSPVYSPKYLVSPGGRKTYRILRDLRRLDLPKSTQLRSDTV